MNELATNQEKSSALDKPVQQREAWRLLQAEYGNQNIEPDKWRLLSVALAHVPEDELTRAVVLHMRQSPYFPKLSDIQNYLPLTQFQKFCALLARRGYRLVHDGGVGGVSIFSNGTQEAHVHR